ncbi:MAG: hypothetical protein Q9210_004032 [Variospora velana]
MSRPPYFEFDSLKHAIGRRKTDYQHFLASIAPPPLGPDFFDLVEQVRNIEAALNRSPPVLPPESHARIVATLQSMTSDAVAFGKQVELNPFRMQRRSPHAQTEEAIEALRLASFHRWSQVLQEMEGEIARYWDKTAERRVELPFSTRLFISVHFVIWELWCRSAGCAMAPNNCLHFAISEFSRETIGSVSNLSAQRVDGAMVLVDVAKQKRPILDCSLVHDSKEKTVERGLVRSIPGLAGESGSAFTQVRAKCGR